MLVPISNVNVRVSSYILLCIVQVYLYWKL